MRANSLLCPACSHGPDPTPTHPAKHPHEKGLRSLYDSIPARDGVAWTGAMLRRNGCFHHHCAWPCPEDELGCSVHTQAGRGGDAQAHRTWNSLAVLS